VKKYMVLMPCSSPFEDRVTALDEAPKDCALLLWTVSSLLPEALDVVESWGFR